MEVDERKPDVANTDAKRFELKKVSSTDSRPLHAFTALAQWNAVALWSWDIVRGFTALYARPQALQVVRHRVQHAKH
jgi:hypothetical protein